MIVLVYLTLFPLPLRRSLRRNYLIVELVLLTKLVVDCLKQRVKDVVGAAPQQPVVAVENVVFGLDDVERLVVGPQKDVVVNGEIVVAVVVVVVDMVAVAVVMDIPVHGVPDEASMVVVVVAVPFVVGKLVHAVWELVVSLVVAVVDQEAEIVEPVAEDK